MSLEDIASRLSNGEFKNIVFMVGAGISTAAGIPDFRSPKTGLYANLKRLKLPYPEAVFSLDYFRDHPEAFYTLADELFPGKFQPTKFHYLMKLIQDRGLLRRIYTQNIDTLEQIAGVDEKFIVAAHGSFAKAHCIECNAEYSTEWIKEVMMGEKNGKIGIPKCSKCKGYVKPDIVFFGENLPELFFDTIEQDFPKNADLVIVAGTSLQVHPFASLPEQVNCPRVLFNLEKVGTFGRKKKDVLVLDDCDKGAERLVKLCGWTLPGPKTENKVLLAEQELEVISNSLQELEQHPDSPRHKDNDFADVIPARKLEPDTKGAQETKDGRGENTEELDSLIKSFTETVRITNKQS